STLRKLTPAALVAAVAKRIASFVGHGSCGERSRTISRAGILAEFKRLYKLRKKPLHVSFRAGRGISLRSMPSRREIPQLATVLSLKFADNSANLRESPQRLKPR